MEIAYVPIGADIVTFCGIVETITHVQTVDGILRHLGQDGPVGLGLPIEPFRGVQRAPEHKIG